MSTDYSKKKNAELEELLKARSLPHTGKKADLIARLVQNDTETSTTSAPTTAIAPANDEIDWDDEAIVDAPPSVPNKTKAIDPLAAAAKASSAPSAYALASGGIGPISNPTAVPNQIVATDPSTTNDLTVSAPDPIPTSATVPDTEAEADPSKTATATGTATPDPAPHPPPTNYSRNVPPTELEIELEKRKARAKRFGLVEEESTTDTIKALERAKRFGTTTSGDAANVFKTLDKALPERLPRKRGRADDTREAGSSKRIDSGRSRERRGGRSQERGGRRGGGRRGNSGPRDRDRDRDNRGGNRPRSQNRLSEKDRLAAEARKKRFATAA